ncbi:MAG: hypothetical protein QOE36_2901 [Gaiellaceae bacterium]|jgi:MFS family permease|nr:hypothetical protein [Gaiellaceae bacterium]
MLPPVPARERLRETVGAAALVVSNPGLRRLQLAWAGSIVGTWAYGVALIVFAYDEGGATAVGVVGFVRWTAAAFAAPLAGILGDRLPRVRVMVASDALRAAAIVGAAGAAAADLPYAVYALAVVVSVSATAFRPAQAALVPGLARSPEELTAANVTATTIESVGIFAGPALGGLLLGLTSTAVVFAASAATLVWSALLVSRIDEPPRGERAETERESFRSEISAGFHTIVAERSVRVLVGLFAAQTFVDGALSVLVVVASLQLLDLGNSGVGYINSAMGIGGVLGALVTFSLVRRWRLAPSFGLGIVIWGLPIALVAAWPNPWIAFVLFGFCGLGNTLVDVTGTTLLQRSAPDEVLARVFGVLESLIVGSIALGAVAAPLLVAWLGIRGALVAVGAVLPVLALLSGRRLAAIDDTPPPEEELELLRRVPFLAPLPDQLLDGLARRVERESVEPGTTIVRAGERGDRFYVVVDGEVEVTPRDGPPSLHGRGGYFGEIALLRGVPRTATVMARTTAELLVLDGKDFVDAVAGAPRSIEAADAVVGARLGIGRR